jgi:hypothetical protein
MSKLAGGWASIFVFDLRVPHPAVPRVRVHYLFSPTKSQSGRFLSNCFVFNARIIFLTLEVSLWYTSFSQFPLLSSSFASTMLPLPLSLPESTLLQVLIPNSFIPFRIRLYKKIGGRGPLLLTKSVPPQANRKILGSGSASLSFWNQNTYF